MPVDPVVSGFEEEWAKLDLSSLPAGIEYARAKYHAREAWHARDAEVADLQKSANNGVLYVAKYNEAIDRAEAAEARIIALTEANQRLREHLAKVEDSMFVSKWIDVKQKLPPNGQTVIVHGGIAYRLEDEWITQTGRASGSVISWPVTHWQPLPAPPSGEQAASEEVRRM